MNLLRGFEKPSGNRDNFTQVLDDDDFRNEAGQLSSTAHLITKLPETSYRFSNHVENERSLTTPNVDTASPRLGNKKLCH